MTGRRFVDRLTPGARSRAYPSEPPPAPPRPPRQFQRWTPRDLARRRSLVVARAELEAAELRDDTASVVKAWGSLVAALEADESARADPGWSGDALTEALADQDDADDDPYFEDVP